TVNLGDTSGTVSVPTGTVTLAGAFENVIGTRFNDTITGNSLDNNLQGGDGDDTIVSTTGGSDQVDGGNGNDTFVLDSSATITVTDISGTDTVDLSQVAGTGVTGSVGADSGLITKNVGIGFVVIGTSTAPTSIETIIGTGQDDSFIAINT